MAKSASARRAAKAARAEAKRKEDEGKRAARAQAKAAKEAEAGAKQALVASKVAKLVAELKLLVDNACDHFASQMREAAERTSHLRDDFGLTQFEIGAAVGRSQAWVSMILRWKEAGFPDTAFGPQSKARDARRLSGPDNPPPPEPPIEPEAEVGHPDLRVKEGQPHPVGPKLTGNDVDTEAPAEARNAAASEPEPCDTGDNASAPDDVIVSHVSHITPSAINQNLGAILTADKLSDDALSGFKKACDQFLPAMTVVEDRRKARVHFMTDCDKLDKKARTEAA